MENFKALTLTALAALTTLAPAAQAKFTNNDGITFYEAADFNGAHAELVNKLYDIGVPVLDGRETELCEFDGEGEVLGWYTGSKNFMVICYGDQAMREETLTHEAVHVMQDCRDGLETDNIVDPSQKLFNQIVNRLDKSKADTIVNLYDKSDWLIEAEAFYYETHPQIVSNGLSNVCGASWSF